MINHDPTPEELAEELDALLNGDSSPRHPLARTAERLHGAPHPRLNDAARDRIRMRMLEAVPQKRRAFPPIVWAAAVAALVIFIMGGLLFPAMAASAPGDWLYPVKREVEKIEFALARDDVSRAQVHIRQAKRRLDEAEKLLQRGAEAESVLYDALLSAREAKMLLVNADTLDDRARESLLFDANAFSEQFAVILARDDTPNVIVLSLPDDPLASPPEIAPPEIVPPTPTTEPTTEAGIAPTDSPTDTPTDAPTDSPTDTPDAVVIIELPDGTVTAEPPDAPIAAMLTGDRGVNVREGPGTHYPLVRVYPPGTVVTVLSRVDGWMRVQLPDDLIGYIAEFLLTLADDDGEFPPLPPPAQSAPPVAPGNPPVNPPGQGDEPPGGGNPPVNPPGHGGEPPGGGNPPVNPPGHGDEPPGGPPATPPGQGNRPEEPPGRGRGGGG